MCLSDRSLEIFSCYDPSPSYVEQDEGELFGPAFWHMVEQEDWFIWDADKPHHTSYDVSRWVEEVSHPEKYRFEGFVLESDVSDPEYIPDPYLSALFDRITTRVDEDGVIHIDMPPELQAIFNHTDSE